MASFDSSQATKEIPFQAVSPDIADIAGIARRGWAYIAAGPIVGLLCAVAVLSSLPPTYKASSRIAFERTLPRYLQENKVTNEPLIDDVDTLGQVFMISSDGIVLPVVKALALTSDPEFVGSADGQKLSARLRDMVRSAAHAVGLQDQEAPSQHTPEKVALDTLLRNLSVSRADVPSVINVVVSSEDPVKAATIANAIVDKYLETNIASKVKSADLAGKVGQARVDELKRQVADAEQALLEYKSANNLLNVPNSALEGPSHSFQFHLTTAQVAMADAKARMDRFVAGGMDSALVPDNDLIRSLRSQLLDLTSREKDIASRVGRDHLAAAKVRERMEEVRGAIVNEQKRLSDIFLKDYDLARARYDRLTEALSDRWGEKTKESHAKVRELETATDTLRTLYIRMLQQVSEMSKVEAQPSISPDARILVRATPPTQTEASKKRVLILVGGSLLGLAMSGSIVLLRSSPFGVFRTPEQVEAATGIRCAVLPAIASASEQPSLRSGEYALDAPYSRFAETLRSIWTLINIAQRESKAKVICVISSVPGEGKTTVATNLAAHFACHSSTRVLVIDADFHRQSLTERVAPDARVGLKEALMEPKELASYVVRKERLNLDVLPCPIAQRLPNAAELLGTAEMKQLMDTARRTYELVIIEAPPMAAVVDYNMIQHHCDGFVFVVEWGKTTQRMVIECLNDASAFIDRVICIVLNKVDQSALRSIEHYKGDRFHDYYSDTKPKRAST